MAQMLPRRPLLVLCCALLAASAAPAEVERTLKIQAPRLVKAGVSARASITAATTAGGGERVGFLHVEVSLDDGATWQALSYLDNGGATETRRVDLPVLAAGGRMRLRARAAFRGGAAGDVDFAGAPIQWESTWGEWTEPPARHALIVFRS
jgi:hypothetical protein